MKMSAIFSRRLFCRGQGTTYPTKVPPRRLSVCTQDPGPPVCRRCHGTGKYRNLPQSCSRHIIGMPFSRVEAKDATSASVRLWPLLHLPLKYLSSWHPPDCARLIRFLSSKSEGIDPILT